MKNICFKEYIGRTEGKLSHRFADGRKHKRTDENTDCKTYIQTDILAVTKTDRQTTRKTKDRRTDILTDIQLKRKTDLQTAKQKDENIHFGICV